MPGPLVATVAANATGNLVGNVWSTFVSPWFEAPTYTQRLETWRASPVLMPDPGQLIGAWQKGFIQPSTLSNWVRDQGISLPVLFVGQENFTGFTDQQRAWTRVVQSMETPVPVDILLRKHALGPGIDAELDKSLRLSGFGTAYQRDHIKDRREIPTLGMVMEARNKGYITDEQQERYFVGLGFTNNVEREVLNKLRYQWPTPTDLIPFAVKDIWIPEIVQRFQYDADFPAVFQTFMSHAGMGWKPSDLGVQVPPAQDITWPQAYWRAHWQVLSPTQAGTAVSFLRPAVPGSPKSRRPGIPAFTEGDFDLIMRTADYPPIMREWLRGLAYAALTRVDIRRMYNLGVVDRDEVLQLYMDIGYDTTNAELLTKFTEQEKEQRQNSRNKARLESIIRKLYLSCVYSRDDFVRATYAIRRPTTEKRNKFLGLSEAEQLAEANQDANLQLEVNVLGLERKAKRQNRVVGHIQSLARQGLGTTPQFAEWLEKAGVQPDCIGPMIDDMLLEWEMRRKEPTVAQMLRYVTRGAVTPQEVAGRLLNLGYKSNDVAAMIGIAQQDAAAKIAAQQKALASNLRQEQRAQQAQLAALRRQRNEVIADLNKSATKAELLRLYRKGLISAAETRVALLQRGVFERDADAMIREATPNEEG